jgi:hypothetical protein
MVDGPSVGYPEEDESCDITLAAQGSLCLVQSVGSPCSRYISIWLFVDSEKRVWTKEYTIHMLELWRFFITLEILVDRRILMLNSFKKEGDIGASCNYIVLEQVLTQA